MTLGPDLILRPPSIDISIALEPAYNALTSLVVLTNIHSHSGLDEWVAETAASLSPQQKETNLLLFAGLGADTLANATPRQTWPTFLAYIDDVAAQEPGVLRDRLLQSICNFPSWDPSANRPDPARLLADVDAFISYHQQIFKTLKVEKIELDKSLYTRLHPLLNDPPALQEQLVSHLRTMWHQVLAPEWARILPVLQESVAAFQQLNYAGSTPLKAARLITGRDLSSTYFADIISKMEHIVFVPSLHIGPYVTTIVKDRAMRLVFGARMPKGTTAHSAVLSISELLRQLNALADKTRLNILLWIMQHEEVCAQDIIDHFNLSQSTASRHLRQLSATGFLQERRAGGAKKCYTLNASGVDELLDTLAHFLKDPSPN